MKQFPAITPDAAEWGLSYNTQKFGSDLNGATQTSALPGAFWTCTLTFSNRTGRDVRRLKGFMAGLRGRTGRCYIGPVDWQDLGTRGLTVEQFNVTDGGVDEAFAVVVDGQQALFGVANYGGTYTITLSANAVQGDKTLSIQGLPVSEAEVFLAGDFIQVGQELKKLTADADSDASGNATLEIAPPVRDPQSTGEDVITYQPASVMMAVDDAQASRSLSAPEFYNITLEFREPLDT